MVDHPHTIHRITTKGRPHICHILRVVSWPKQVNTGIDPAAAGLLASDSIALPTVMAPRL
jgi:hypothetical protein